MEEAFEAERAKPGPAKYKNMPVLNEPLKGQLAELLTDAATLERQYQILFDNGHKDDADMNELSELHQRWLSSRERFIDALKEGNWPESVLELAVPTLGQMADRIANLEKRVFDKTRQA